MRIGFLHGESGVSTTEYALMLVIVALAIAAGGSELNIKEAIVGVFSLVQDLLNS